MAKKTIETCNPIFQPSMVNIKKKDIQEQRTRSLINRWLNQLQAMAVFNGGSETLPLWRIWQMLMRNGYGAIAPYEGKLHFLLGGLGGPLDENYFPTLFVGANPALNWSYSLKIGEDCVLCKFDTGMEGVLPLLNYFASFITANELSMYIALINSRSTEMIQTARDADKKAADAWLSDLEEGKLGSILGNNILKGIQVQPFAGKTGILTDLIELEQYLKASLANDIGLDANYNMKRESLSTAESQMNDDALFPTIDDIENNQLKWIGDVNDKWGDLLELGEITFELGSSWARNKKEADVSIEMMDNLTEQEEATEESEEKEVPEDEAN